MTTEELLFYLLRYEIKGEELPDGFVLTEQETKDLYRLSKKHDLAHLIGDALFRRKLLTEGKPYDAFNKQLVMAVLRVEQQTAEFKNICETLESAQIPFIPLKGSILREFYPEPWMRTSCDIDVLIRKEDIQKATQALTENGFETDGKENFHDVNFYKGNIHLELHFNICENNEQIDGVLSKVWDYSVQVGSYEYRETSEYYVFHHIAHMAYHFLAGGCGIRPFLDLWILRKNNFYEDKKLIPLLAKSNLSKFYESVNKLINVWINGEQHDDLTSQMEQYVLSGGVYGTSANANTVGAATSKGKRKYLLKIAFPSYTTMCTIYPSLKKRKLLLPFYYIHRVFVKIFGKDRKRVKARIDDTMSQSKENIFSVSKLLNELELNK